MEDSIFTRIINGEIPSYKIYEDDHCIAMLDINPLANGHTLVIPKKQVDLLWDLPQEEYQYLWLVARKISKAIQVSLNPLRVGAVVEGFGVPHAHIHLVPLYDKNVLQLHHGYPVENNPNQLTEFAEKISKELA